MLSRPRVRTWLGPGGLARRRRALEAVEKVVTTRRRNALADAAGWRQITWRRTGAIQAG
jgi:hypothetical protein